MVWVKRVGLKGVVERDVRDGGLVRGRCVEKVCEDVLESVQIAYIKRVCCTCVINVRTALLTDDEVAKPVLPRRRVTV